MIDTNRLAIFAPEGSRTYGEKVAAALGLSLAPLEERHFSDGEGKSRPLESVRGKDIHIIHALYGEKEQSVHDKLCRLLFLTNTLKDAGADFITVHAPYLCYARKDRQTKTRDPVTTRYIACLLETAGTDRIVTMDVHNLQAFQNAFRCRTEHLEGKCLFADHISARLKTDNLAVIAPDTGGIKRAMPFAKEMEKHTKQSIPVRFMEKTRSQDVVAGAEKIYGDIQGRTAIIYDDMIASGTTMQRAARACRKQGAISVYAAATHGLFTGEANRIFADSVFDGIIITDTIPPDRLTDKTARAKLAVINSAPFIAAAIYQLHSHGSICSLNECGI